MATRPPPTTTTAPASPRYQTCLDTNSPSPATPTTGPSHREPPKPTAQRLVRPPNGQHRAPTLTTVLRRQRTDRSYGKLRPMLNPLLMRNTRGTPKRSASGPTRRGPGAWPLMRKTPLMYVTRSRRRNAKPFTMHRPMTSTSGPLTNLPIPGDADYQPEPSRASEAEGPTDEGSASADDRQHADDKAAADEPAPDSEDPRPSDSEDEPRSGPDGSWEWKGRSLTPEESRSCRSSVAEWCQRRRAAMPTETTENMASPPPCAASRPSLNTANSSQTPRSSPSRALIASRKNLRRWINSES